MQAFSSELELRIDWSEIDILGHVNSLAILKYVQAARVQYLEGLGLMQSQAEQGIGPILASLSCQYRKPLFYPGKVRVRCKVDEIGNTSFRMQHSVCADGGEVVAEAQDVIVLYDFAKATKTPIPGDLRARIQQVECARGARTLKAAAQAGM